MRLTGRLLPGCGFSCSPGSPACRPALMPVCSIACLPYHPQVNKMASEQRSYSFEPFDWQ